MSENTPPTYGAYPPPQMPENNGGTSVTNPASDPYVGLTPTQPAPKKNRHMLAGIVTSLVIVGLAVGGYFALRSTGMNDASTPAAATSTTKQPTKLQAAATKCTLAATPEDLGRTLTLNNVEAKKNPGADHWSDAECVFRELNVPSSVMDHIGQTRALDGMQTDSWDGMNARWNYHPDNGMNITFTEAK